MVIFWCRIQQVMGRFPGTRFEFSGLYNSQCVQNSYAQFRWCIHYLFEAWKIIDINNDMVTCRTM